MADKLDVEARTAGAGSPASQQVSWWPVHQFLESVVNQANCGPLPVAGTPAWQQLADGDPRKLLALAIGGEHWALRTEIAQEQRSEASREIAAAGGWTAMAQRIRNGRGAAYIERKKTA